jgi:hypothetical protein
MSLGQAINPLVTVTPNEMMFAIGSECPACLVTVCQGTVESDIGRSVR